PLRRLLRAAPAPGQPDARLAGVVIVRHRWTPSPGEARSARMAQARHSSRPSSNEGHELSARPRPARRRLGGNRGDGQAPPQEGGAFAALVAAALSSGLIPYAPMLRRPCKSGRVADAELFLRRRPSRGAADRV